MPLIELHGVVQTMNVQMYYIIINGGSMKTSLLAVSLLTFAAGAAFADRLRDWHDLEEVHTHIVESIHEMERARAANHYDMAGHGAKTEELLRQAERESHAAVEAAKAAR
jgi:uncharacterized protein involved in response to NO